jgi:ketosteroid isomerase-like protein
VPDAEVVRAFYDAWSVGDVPAMLALVDPEVEVEPILGVLYARERYQGQEDLAAWFGEVAARWDTFGARVERARTRGDTVVAFVHLAGHRGEETFDAWIGVECRFRDGRIVSFRGRDVWEVEEELAVGF